MPPTTILLGGHELRVVDRLDGPTAPIVLLLHGFSMRADDLAPFGASLGLPALFLFPEGPLDLAPRGLPGRAWWLVDTEARSAAIARGDDRDLSQESPPGLPGARDDLGALVDQVVATWPGRPLFLGGFSQGAILSLDLVLRTARRRPTGLVLLSSGRVTQSAWAPLLPGLRGLPIFQSHGQGDRDLSFAAARALKDDLVVAGAVVSWWPFDGGHEIPLQVLRELKRFIRAATAGATASADSKNDVIVTAPSAIESRNSDVSASTPEQGPNVVRRIGVEIAAAHADDVDRRARFPAEAIEALKKEKLLGAFVPKELGGLGYGMVDLANMCTTLAQHCASTGMVVAMHHIQVACLVRHGAAQPLIRRYLTELCERQLLLASVTSEVGVGGDTRSSVCAVESEGGRFTLNKDATTISYGEQADDLLVTCRRAPDAVASDQVLVLLRKGDYTLTRTTNWDTLGMRGTCSPGFKLVSSGVDQQIVPGSFADSSAQTMVPFSHILWSGVWLGIASDAVGRASAFVRAEARKKPGVVPPTALRLAELSTLLQSMRNNAQAVAAECDSLLRSPEGTDALLSLGFALKMNNLKILSSQSVAEIVHKALGICGIMGYKNDSNFSLGRQLRDSLSAALMIGNDRILAKSASLLLVYKDE